MRRRICVVTTTRADYGYLRPVMLALHDDADVELQVIASGTHLSKAFGMTVTEVEADNLPIAERVEMDLAGADAASTAVATTAGAAGFARAYARLQPDVLVLLGDRYETLGAAFALLPFVRPIAHVAGGESTEGAIDEGIRHALTKLSHLHFVAAEEYARRVIQMGEEPWRVTVSGAPTLDNMLTIADLTDAELEQKIGMPLDPHILLVTFHPATLEPDTAAAQAEELVVALERIDYPVVLTYPNADTHADDVIAAVRAFAARKPATRRLIMNLGSAAYFALMRRAAAMVGNSSSGIIEAASFGLPVVDIGERQRGRAHGVNVLHAACNAGAIQRAIEAVLHGDFRDAARKVKNPYGDGHAAERIARVLRTVPLDERLMKKRFHTP
jgi:UDP-hydrolysing UDP-N-acetyl-D-glucosamine 2-epimerase